MPFENVAALFDQWRRPLPMHVAKRAGGMANRE
jgi:hypothetical protein